MRFWLFVTLALVMVTLESVLVHYLGWHMTRIDATLVLIAFLSLRASTTEGALASFVIGYLLDLGSGRPTGLYVFLAVLAFLAGRLVSSLVDVRSRGSFVLLTAGLTAGHQLLATFFLWLTAKEGSAPWAMLSALPGQVAITTVVAVILHPLLRRLDGGADRPEPGALRTTLR